MPEPSTVVLLVVGTVAHDLIGPRQTGTAIGAVGKVGGEIDLFFRRVKDLPRLVVDQDDVIEVQQLHHLAQMAVMGLVHGIIGGGYAVGGRIDAGIDAAGVRFRDNRFGIDVLAGENPFAVYDAASLQRYLDTVFHDRSVQPAIPWPASRAVIDWRIAQAPFEQQVLDRIGRGGERFLPGEMAAAIRQPALLLWCRQDRVIDPSAMALYARQMPQAIQVSLDGCGHMSIMEKPDDVAAAVALLIQRGVPSHYQWIIAICEIGQYSGRHITFTLVQWKTTRIWPNQRWF